MPETREMRERLGSAHREGVDASRPWKQAQPPQRGLSSCVVISRPADGPTEGQAAFWAERRTLREAGTRPSSVLGGSS